MLRRFWLPAAATALLLLAAAPASAIPPNPCGRVQSCVTTYYANGYPGAPSGAQGYRCDGYKFSWGDLSGQQVTVYEDCGGTPV